MIWTLAPGSMSTSAYSITGLLIYLTIVAMRQKHHQPALHVPASLTRRNKLVNHNLQVPSLSVKNRRSYSTLTNLGIVGKVAKLSLPHDQRSILLTANMKDWPKTHRACLKGTWKPSDTPYSKPRLANSLSGLLAISTRSCPPGAMFDSRT